MTEPLRIAEPAGGWFDPWTRLIELADALPESRWALVGGLMVQAHAMAAGIETTRITTDVDAAVRVEAGAYSYTEAAAVLQELGYELDSGTRYAYRFHRQDGVVDLMVADHARPLPRYNRREVMQVVAGQQALGRLNRLVIESHGEHLVSLPSLHAALVLKGAARIADTRDRDRHTLDAITLMACLVDAESVVTDFAGSDRKRIVALIRALEEQPLLFAQVPDNTALLARRSIGDFQRLLRMS